MNDKACRVFTSCLFLTPIFPGFTSRKVSLQRENVKMHLRGLVTVLLYWVIAWCRLSRALTKMFYITKIQFAASFRDGPSLNWTFRQFTRRIKKICKDNLSELRLDWVWAPSSLEGLIKFKSNSRFGMSKNEILRKPEPPSWSFCTLILKSHISKYWPKILSLMIITLNVLLMYHHYTSIDFPLKVNLLCQNNLATLGHIVAPSISSYLR